MLLTGTPSMLAATWLGWVSWMTPAGPCLGWITTTGAWLGAGLGTVTGMTWLA